jgi:predicted esterase YcpF (UPF0227 family)
MKKVIINIHGFNSGPGQKAVELSIQFPDSVLIHAPQLSYQPEKAIEHLRTILDLYKGHEVHIVGTSLGGFYAMYLSTIYCDQVSYYFYIINPSFTPHLTLTRHNGETVTNYKTQEQFKVTYEFLNELRTIYQAMIQNYTAQSINSSSFFLSTQDELLDFKEVIMFIRSFEVPYRLSYSQQDHRFQDISDVVRAIKENMIG